MNATLEQLGIDRMTTDERLELIGLIWDSIESEPENFTLSDAQKEELDRRLADADAHPGTGVPWETVKAEAQARLNRPS